MIKGGGKLWQMHSNYKTASFKNEYIIPCTTNSKVCKRHVFFLEEQSDKTQFKVSSRNKNIFFPF